MIIIRKSEERGHHREDWLDSRHTFSFHNYYDPRHMGFRTLRVINEDHVQPDHGFGMHPHNDMEIFSMVLSGSLEHQDNLGNREVIGPYQLQMFSAGTGIRHSERNPSSTEIVHFLQVWILPDREGLEPGYEIKDFSLTPLGELIPILTPDGRQDSARLHQDVTVFLGRFAPGTETSYQLARNRHAWIQVISGQLVLNGNCLEEGDGAAVSEEPTLQFAFDNPTELLLFDLN